MMVPRYCSSWDSSFGTLDATKAYQGDYYMMYINLHDQTHVTDIAKHGNGTVGASINIGTVSLPAINNQSATCRNEETL